MRIDHLFSGIPVADLAEALRWYERFLGRPPDMRPNDQEAVWWLVDKGSLYVVADRERAGKAVLTLIVDNLDMQVAELASRGLPAPSMEALPGVYQKAVIRDPEGNLITLAELSSGG